MVAASTLLRPSIAALLPRIVSCAAPAGFVQGMNEGSLAPRGVVPTDRIPWGMTLSPDGRFLAVTGYESATLVLHRIAADGSLTRAATLPFDKHVADIVAR